jgi:hypothetical protein
MGASNATVADPLRRYEAVLAREKRANGIKLKAYRKVAESVE